MDISSNIFTKKNRLNLNEPKWDQSLYWGRVKHFMVITNPLNLLHTSAELDRAKDIVVRYKKGEDFPNLTDDDIWKEKHLYDSAFHPDTGEKVFILGRMSALVPINLLVTGGMITFYKTTLALITWQWINQTANAVVNYCNRGGDSEMSTAELAGSYLFATGTAVLSTTLLNMGVAKLNPGKNSLLPRIVPFLGVSIANSINIPSMRMQELKDGVPVSDADGNVAGHSRAAAKLGISECIFSRTMMALTSMTIPPLIITQLVRRRLIHKSPWMTYPLQIGVLGAVSLITTPLCNAIFPQKETIKVTNVENEIQEKVKSMWFKGISEPPKVLYFNKGL